MRLNLCLIVVLFFLISCDTEMVNPNKLVGKWDNTNQIQQKGSDGKWSDWITINTFVALPQLEFTKDGKILYDGKPSESCCSFLSYNLKGKEIVLSDFANTGGNCAVVDCFSCQSWLIEKLKDGVLELNNCDNNKIRYVKAE